jgi:hypothetical protein
MSTEPLDVQTLANALYRVWPRTFGSRMSWSQPSIEMAAAIAREYDAARAAQDVAGRESEDELAAVYWEPCRDFDKPSSCQTNDGTGLWCDPCAYRLGVALRLEGRTQPVEGRDGEAASLRAALDECRQHHADTLAGLDPHDLGAQKGRDELQRVHDEAADGFRWWTSAAPTEEEVA